MAQSSVAAAEPTPEECARSSEAALEHEQRQKLGLARERLIQCTASTCSSDVREECERRLIALNSAQPTVVLQAKDATGNDLTAVVVLLDGTQLVEALDGSALAVDPGRHTFRFEKADARPVEQTVLIRVGEKRRPIRVVFEESGKAAPAQSTAPTDVSLGADSAGVGDSQRTIALIVGGVGLAGVGVGTFYGLRASAKWSDAQDQCGSGCSAASPAQESRDEARSAATVSTIAFAAGAGALVAAGLLWFTAPRSAERSTPVSVYVTPEPGVRGGFVSIGGAL